MSKLRNLTIGVLFLSLSFTIFLAALNLIRLVVFIPVILSIMGFYGVIASLLFLKEKTYYIAWSTILLNIGLLWILCVYFPKYWLYLLLQ